MQEASGRLGLELASVAPLVSLDGFADPLIVHSSRGLDLQGQQTPAPSGRAAIRSSYSNPANRWATCSTRADQAVCWASSQRAITASSCWRSLRYQRP